MLKIRTNPVECVYRHAHVGIDEKQNVGVGGLCPEITGKGRSPALICG